MIEPGTYALEKISTNSVISYARRTDLLVAIRAIKPDLRRHFRVVDVDGEVVSAADFYASMEQYVPRLLTEVPDSTVIERAKAFLISSKVDPATGAGMMSMASLELGLEFLRRLGFVVAEDERDE
jgi:hypothetical protein